MHHIIIKLGGSEYYITGSNWHENSRPSEPHLVLREIDAADYSGFIRVHAPEHAANRSIPPEILQDIHRAYSEDDKETLTFYALKYG